MSNQLQITGGAKVRNLQGVITGTSGVLGSLGINVPDGIPQLDGSGKILVSQLPNSVMEYKGTWNVATNTPYLVDGVGNAGDVYIVTGAATGGTLHNFGAGNILFYNGDQAIYDGSLWQRASGSTGSVTSVAMTTPTGLSVTGSPITTNGTLALSVASGYSIPLTTQLVPTGGTTGQILAKNSDTAFDTTWIDNYTEDIRDTVKAAVAINKGQAVYISGASGTNQLVSLASYDSESLSSQTLGISLQTLAINDIGQIITYGLIAGLNTSTATAGDPVYLGANGALIFGYANKPQAPYHLVYMGVVTRVSATVGEIFVNISNGWELDELHNVKIVSPSNNQGIFYNSSNSLWENKSIATALGYTPANDSLVVHLAGTETITGAKTFSSVITGDAGIILKEGVVPSSVGYTGLAGDADGLLVTKKIGSTAYTNLLYFNSATSNTYTFPNLSGTIALLEGTQTFSGAKTFSGDILAINYYRVQQNSSIATAPSGYSTFGAINTKLNFGVGIGVSTQKVFQFETSGLTNNTTRVYTLPDATGTIALTSNLSSYLPLTGGTLTGALIGTSATFSSSVGIGVASSSDRLNVLGVDYNNAAYLKGGSTTGASYGLQIVAGTNSTDYSLSVQSVSGSNYLTVRGNGNVGIGLTNPQRLLEVYSTTADNHLRLSGSGPSVSMGEAITGSVYQAKFGLATASNQFVSGSVAGDFVISNQTGSTIWAYNSVEKMRLNTNGRLLIGTSTDNGSLLQVAGAATFSSSVTANNLTIGPSTTFSTLNFNYNGTNNKGGLAINYNTGEYQIWAGESSNGYFQTFYTNGSERMRITSGGNLLVGTTTDVGQKFVVNGGVATIDNYLTMRSTVNSTNYGLINEGNGLIKFAIIGVQNSAQITMSSGAYTALSDSTKKKDFELSTLGLNEVMKLKPTLYRFKTENNNVPKSLGFIAQEVKQVIPQAYVENGEGENKFIGLNFNPIVATLTKAIQEQQAQIEELKQLINK